MYFSFSWKTGWSTYRVNDIVLYSRIFTGRHLFSATAKESYAEVNSIELISAYDFSEAVTGQASWLMDAAWKAVFGHTFMASSGICHRNKSQSMHRLCDLVEGRSMYVSYILHSHRIRYETSISNSSHFLIWCLSHFEDINCFFSPKLYILFTTSFLPNWTITTRYQLFCRYFCDISLSFVWIYCLASQLLIRHVIQIKRRTAWCSGVNCTSKATGLLLWNGAWKIILVSRPSWMLKTRQFRTTTSSTLSPFQWLRAWMENDWLARPHSMLPCEVGWWKRSTSQTMFMSGAHIESISVIIV